VIGLAVEVNDLELDVMGSPTRRLLTSCTTWSFHQGLNVLDLRDVLELQEKGPVQVGAIGEAMRHVSGHNGLRLM